ncbi:MAG TPA: hypothetical protein VGL81_07465 [Polyangiaceae bacterium]|jgi:hypothetical protein
MASALDRLFRPFEGTRNAYPLGLFRMAFFVGLALHFFPTLLHLDEAYRPGALRSEQWSEWLYEHFLSVPHGALRVGSIVTMLACLTAIAGVLPRASAVVCGVGFYVFASFNSMYVQTLALMPAWAILLLWMICGGGAAALSLPVFGSSPEEPATRVEPRLLSGLILYQVLLGVFFSGVEKLIAGWPWTNEMGIVLSYPTGFMVRDWVAASSFMRGSLFTHALSWFTIGVELGTPIGLLFRRTRVAALVIFELFFLGIVAMLEVPPLFYCIFAFGGVLALDDDEVARVQSFVVRTRKRLMAGRS